MKRHSLLIAFALGSLWAAAQPKGAYQEQPKNMIPKHEAAKPVVNKPLAIKQSFATYISTVNWRGARTWKAGSAATVDSVTQIQFFTDGTVSWNKQGWEYVPKTKGTYTVTGNKVVIRFNYAPYSHYIEATYDESTGKITGTFREDRAAATNAPAAYTPGTTAGEISFIKK